MKPIFPIAFLLMLSTSGFAQAKASTKPDQLHFTAEADVRHAVPLPDAAWNILQHEESVTSVLSQEHLFPEQLPRFWFSAAAVHLHNPTDTDYVVETNQTMSGANVTSFWIFRKHCHRPQAGLTIPAHDLIVRPLRFHGYKTIEASTENCCTISFGRFRFNGKEYIRVRHWSEDIH